MSESSMPSTVRILSSIIKLPARYMSWLSRACNNKGPVVGRLSTMETMASPDIKVGSSQPIVLINGLIAMRTGYLRTSLMGLTPFAQAMPNQYKDPDNPVSAYRHFYRAEKSVFAKWTKREMPDWLLLDQNVETSQS